MWSPFRRKGRKHKASSAEEEEGQQGGAAPPGGSAAGSRRGLNRGEGGSQRSVRGESVRRNSTSNAAGKEAAREAGSSPSNASKRKEHHTPAEGNPFRASHDARSTRSRPSPGGGGGGGAQGSSPTFQGQMPMQQPPIHHGREPTQRSKFGVEEAMEDMLDETSGISAEWAKKSGRERRFTYTTRPDLFKNIPTDFGDVEEEEIVTDDELRILKERLMDDLVRMEETVRGSGHEDSDSESEFEMGGEHGFGGVSSGGRRNSTGTKGSKGSSRPTKKRFRLPAECRFEGDLMKKGNYRRNWNKRRFIVDIRQVKLNYYKGQVLKGTIDLRNATLEYEREVKERRNKGIDPRLEFAITERNDRGRTFYLAALSEEDYMAWRAKLEFIMLLQAEEKINKPVRNKRHGTVDKEEEIDEDKATDMWDEAQNWTAFGRGLYECRIGETASFTVQANDALGNPITPPAGLLPAVVLESNDLHYDVPVVDNDDGTFTAQYVPTRMGDYELSVMLDGFDIYGSPYRPRILAAPACATHCVADGIGLLCAVLNGPNEFVISARNEFDEPSDPEEELNFEITMQAPLRLGEVKNNGDGTYHVTYTIDCPEEDLRALQAESECLSGSITVTLDDKRSMIGSIRHIKGSPFTPGLAASLSPEDLAAAYTASEFTKLLGDHAGLQETLQGKNPFVTFSQILKRSGLLAITPNAAGSSSSSNAIQAGPEEDNKSDATDDVARDAYGVPDTGLPPASTGHNIASKPASDTGPRQEPRGGQRSAAGKGPVSSTDGSSVGGGGSYFPYLGSSAGASAAPTPVEQPTTPTPYADAAGGRSAGAWLPQGHEATLVKESLIERAGDIEREKAELMRKRQELDESRALIDEQVRRMAEIGQRVQTDSERLIEQALTLSTNGAAPAKQAVKENQPNGPNRAAGGAGPKAASGRGAGADAAAAPQPVRKSAGEPGHSNRLVLDKSLVSLFDKHGVVLSRVFEFYRLLNDTNAVQLSDVIKMCQDYDITPTFISRKEICDIYHQVTERSEQVMYSLSYEAFVEVLANVAVHSLSKPMFAHLYSTNLAKVDVLLTMWKVADPIKLSEIQEDAQL